MNKRAMLIANSASMIDHFNKDNIHILKTMGCDITVAANFKDGNSSTNERIAAFETELREQGIDIIDLPIPRNVTQLFKAYRSVSMLKDYLSEHPCALIHTQTPFGGVVGRIAARPYRKRGVSKVIYFVHGFHFFKGASIKSYLIYYNIEKYLSRYTDCLITLNQEDFTAAGKHFHQKDTRYVPGVGIDTDSIHNMSVNIAAKKKSLGIPENKHVVLTVAELIPRKNVEGCIRAFAGLSDNDSILLICGKGKLMPKLKGLCERLGITNQVYFTGYRTDILEIYHIADVFLFTSYQEGLPVAVMQAMAAGLPVAASDIRGNRDLLAPCEGCPSADYLIAVKDTQTFTDKLSYLLSHPEEAKRIGQINTENCRQYFDIRLAHGQMTNIYNDLLKN